ncbi:hypothetical protein [Burkholderia pyrrocinia]|uniref:hypothetical protein n=1 Tax=Burkholderia pyrrocinia TaxID=60550 RepID=UPI003D7667C6
MGPSFSAVFSNGFFISSTGGAGYRYTSPRGIFVSASIGYAGGRKDSISFSGEGSDDLKGMGNVPGSVIALVAGRRARQRERRTAGDDRCADHAHIARVRRTRRSGGAAAACRHQFPILQEAGKFPGFYTAVECLKVAGGHLKCFRTGPWLGDPEWVP